MLTNALPLPVTSTAVRANVDGPEVLRCATPNTSAFHISHCCFPDGSPRQESSGRVPAISQKLYGIVLPYRIAHTSATALAYGIGLVAGGLVPASLPPSATLIPCPLTGRGFLCLAISQAAKSFVLADCNLSL